MAINTPAEPHLSPRNQAPLTSATAPSRIISAQPLRRRRPVPREHLANKRTAVDSIELFRAHPNDTDLSADLALERAESLDECSVIDVADHVEIHSLSASTRPCAHEPKIAAPSTPGVSPSRSRRRATAPTDLSIRSRSGSNTGIRSVNALTSDDLPLDDPSVKKAFELSPYRQVGQSDITSEFAYGLTFARVQDQTLE